MSEYQWHMDDVAAPGNTEYQPGSVIEEKPFDSVQAIFEAFMNDLAPAGIQRVVYLKLTDDDGKEWRSYAAGPRVETFFKDDDGNNGPMVPSKFQTEFQSVV